MLTKWADPKDKLPNEGAQPPFPETWATAQSALRYLGWTRTPRGWGILEKQLHRRNPKLDVSRDSLMQGGLTILGMTLRALGVGASDGFAQWGDPKAYDDLVKYIEDPKENEQSRMEACFALSWVATDDQMKEVVKKVHDVTKHRPEVELDAPVLPRDARPPAGARRDGGPRRPARAGGDGHRSAPPGRARHRHGRHHRRTWCRSSSTKLSDVTLKADAALALILGADADTASRALATYNDPTCPPRRSRSSRTSTTRRSATGATTTTRTATSRAGSRTPQALAHVKVHDELQDWPRIILGRNLVESIEIDNGPHSMTRVQFRVRLFADAKGTNEVKRNEAIALLKFMKEKGVLMALRSEPGPSARWRARRSSR